MANNSDDDTIPLMILGLIIVMLFGGSIAAWFTAKTSAAATWLIQHNILTSREDALIPLGEYGGLDLPRALIAAVIVIILLVLVGKLIRAVGKNRVERGRR